ncbi:unnamed protein product [Protopolystoma xenopodis]|uniref:Uncharacterized protein n=1 Tax=Protopolystoma xenopodis TaxID=117903 RepID=A0A448XIG0_9PLAT|nr:unnamed protein product [Protopolystoma xenopodis]
MFLLFAPESAEVPKQSCTVVVCPPERTWDKLDRRCLGEGPTCCRNAPDSFLASSRSFGPGSVSKPLLTASFPYRGLMGGTLSSPFFSL